jgi:hypothetical protein
MPKHFLSLARSFHWNVEGQAQQADPYPRGGVLCAHRQLLPFGSWFLYWSYEHPTRQGVPPAGGRRHCLGVTFYPEPPDAHDSCYSTHRAVIRQIAAKIFGDPREARGIGARSARPSRCHHDGGHPVEAEVGGHLGAASYPYPPGVREWGISELRLQGVLRSSQRMSLKLAHMGGMRPASRETILRAHFLRFVSREGVRDEGDRGWLR